VYGSTEALFLGSASATGFHVTEDLVVLEIVDDQNRPVSAGSPGHKVLLTNLVNRTLPLIRYELSDTVTLAGGSDPGGLPYACIERVDGRSDDVLRLPAASGGGTPVLSYRLRAPFARLADILQYHIVYDGDRLTVRVVLREAVAGDVLERVAAGLQEALDDAGAVPPPIDVEPVSAIERGGGKLRVVEFRPKGRTT
jgi:phenylacetate-coenzyme A ligase PaaK-like adenylate-forming protein